MLASMVPLSDPISFVCVWVSASVNVHLFVVASPGKDPECGGQRPVADVTEVPAVPGAL